MEYVGSPDELLLTGGTGTFALIGVALMGFFESESESDSDEPDSDSLDDGEAFLGEPLVFTFVVGGLGVEPELELLELELELEDAME